MIPFLCSPNPHFIITNNQGLTYTLLSLGTHRSEHFRKKIIEKFELWIILEVDLEILCSKPLILNNFPITTHTYRSNLYIIFRNHPFFIHVKAQTENLLIYLKKKCKWSTNIRILISNKLFPSYFIANHDQWNTYCHNLRTDFICYYA